MFNRNCVINMKCQTVELKQVSFRSVKKVLFMLNLKEKSKREFDGMWSVKNDHKRTDAKPIFSKEAIKAIFLIKLQMWNFRWRLVTTDNDSWSFSFARSMTPGGKSHCSAFTTGILNASCHWIPPVNRFLV